MRKEDRKRNAAEWREILDSHPDFARAFLAQQAILMEASQNGDKYVDRAMCQLLQASSHVLFEDYWLSRCQEVTTGRVEIGGIIGCLSQTNRDPADCFGSDDDEGWFVDPLAGGRTLPPEPPDPHVK